MERNEASRRLVARIRKLLRLADSANPNEAAAAAAKARQMLAEHNLSMSDIGQEDETLRATRERSKTRQRLEPWAHALAKAVSMAFDCQYYHDTLAGGTVFVGCGSDPIVCRWTYGYLYRTLLKLASAHMRGPARRLRASRSRATARASYLLGAVYVIGSRLEEQKRTMPVTPGALVPAKAAAIARELPALRVRPATQGKLRGDDFSAGMEAAGRIPLSRPLNGAAGHPALGCAGVAP